MKRLILIIITGIFLSHILNLTLLNAAEIYSVGNGTAEYTFLVGESKIYFQEIIDKSSDPPTVYSMGEEIWALFFYDFGGGQVRMFSNADTSACCAADYDSEIFSGFAGEDGIERVQKGCSFNEREVQVLNLHWTGLQMGLMGESYDVNVTVSVRVDSDESVRGSRALFSIDVDNGMRVSDALWVLDHAYFPWFRAPRIQDEEGDRLAVSEAGGKLISNPALHIRERLYGGYSSGKYSMQFQAYYGEESRRGLYMSCRDGHGYVKSFGIEPDEASEGLYYYVNFSCWNHKDVHSFYPGYWSVGNDLHQAELFDHEFGPFRGDWFTAGRIYREWALDQEWTEKGRLMDRDDPSLYETYIPDWLREENMLTLYFSPQRQEEKFDVQWPGEYLPLYKERLGEEHPIVMIWPWWWNREVFIEMRNDPWFRYERPWHYFLNLPEYTGGHCYIGDNDPEKLRRFFPEMLDAMTSLPDIDAHFILPPGGELASFDHFTFDWGPYQVMNANGQRKGSLCFRNAESLEIMADMLADAYEYSGDKIEGFYAGYGYKNLTCYDTEHSHFRQQDEFMGGETFDECIQHYNQTIRGMTGNPHIFHISEMLTELAVSEAEMLALQHFFGRRIHHDSVSPQYDPGHTLDIPLFTLVYHDYVFLIQMMFYYSGIYFHNEYFDGSYVLPSREEKCANTSYDYYVYDEEANAYPSFDAQIGCSFVNGCRINISDLDVAVDSQGVPLHEGRFMEKGYGNPQSPVEKSRNYLKRLLESMDFWGDDPEEDKAGLYLRFGEFLRPPEIIDGELKPVQRHSIIRFNNFFYDYCVLVLGPHHYSPEDAIMERRVPEIPVSAWYLPESDAAIFVVSCWSEKEHVFRLKFSPCDYYIGVEDNFTLAEMTEEGLDHDTIVRYQLRNGPAVSPEITLQPRNIRIFKIQKH